jgi:sugar/nucleoside kinase (ribokinase family)
MPLIVTGTVGIDTIYTPAGHREGVLGGSCTYFAVAASFYGPVRIVAAVGDDLPAEMRAVLERTPGVDTAGLEVREGSRTFRWGGRYHENMDMRDTLFTELGVLEEMPPEIPASFRDSGYVFLGNTHPAMQLEMLAAFPRRQLAVADTMDLWIRTAGTELRELLSRVDGLVLNYDEAELLAGKRNTVAAGRRILGMGPRFVVIKKGEHGCVFVHKDGIAALPAYPAEDVVDPTGAGDSFAGGMMGFLTGEGGRGHAEDPGSFDAIRRSLAHGTVVASFTIEAFGLERLRSITRGELAERFDAFARMIRVA